MDIMKGRILAITGFAGVICLVAGSAMAEMNASAADFNKDGMVTEGELVHFVRLHFSQRDMSGDSSADSSEAENLYFEDDGWYLY